MHIASLLISLLGCSGEEAPPPPVAVGVTDAAPLEVEEGSIESVLADNRGVIETCFRNELREHPKAEGRIEFEWQIDNHRSVAGQVVSSTFPEDYDIDPLATCVIEGAKSWHFPAGTGSVRFPITFTPMS